MFDSDQFWGNDYWLNVGQLYTTESTLTSCVHAKSEGM